ncbi:MAG: ATP-dependent sacrificial sulfur transferase LarE [Synergistota bacterium]|nr:ATP-dependent sacrificial sulfur transferase LarE [Synergistota bacterium]
MDKRSLVQAFFYDNPRTLILLSGGVDSAVLAYLASEAAPETVEAITLRTEFVKDGEISMARSVAETLSMKHHIMDVLIASDPLAAANGCDRCYRCRKAMHAEAMRFALEHGFKTIVDGVQGNEIDTDRPGVKAAREDGVRHPLAEAGLTKNETRSLAREARLPNRERPASPCLATRFPLATPLSVSWARKIEAGERFLETQGFENCRIRFFPPGLASVEVEETDLSRAFERRTVIVQGLMETGFYVVSLDMEGLKRGKMERFREVQDHDPD